MDPDPIKLISSSAQWKMPICNHSNPAVFKSKYLKLLPYKIIAKVQDCIGARWESWRLQAEPLLKRNGIIDITPASLIKHLCDSKYGYKIENLLSMSVKAKTPVFEKYIIPDSCKKYKIPAREMVRAEMDADFSKGFVTDISQKTLKEFAYQLSDNGRWRVMGDAFGFNLQECLELKDPLDMLEKWIKTCQEANAKPTVCRLHFEAEKIGAKSASSFLDAIPLDMIAEIDMFPEMMHWKRRYLTRFDMKRMDEIFGKADILISWREVAKSMVCKINDFEKSPIEGIWWSGDHDMHKLFAQFNNHCDEKVRACLQTFQEELEDGSFDPISPGGISYVKMQYLAQALQEAFNLYVKNDNSYRFFQNLTQQLPKVTRGNGNMDALKFLCIYWQVHQNLDLDAFSLSVEKILPRKLSEAFHDAYLSLKPMREYDPELAAENLKRKAKAKSRNIDDFIGQALDRHFPDIVVDDLSRGVVHPAQGVEAGANEVAIKEQKAKKELCVICIDKKIKALAVPCGHYAFCLDCIQKINTCSLCQKEITHKVEVYPSGVSEDLNL